MARDSETECPYCHRQVPGAHCNARQMQGCINRTLGSSDAEDNAEMELAEEER